MVIGSGGREHALVWKLKKSRLTDKIFAAPGNTGIAELAECVPLDAKKTVELADFAAASKVDLTVVGPEAPLVGGIVDYFRDRKLKIFGPTRAAARLEGSKAFAKEVMERCGVPTPKAERFDDPEAARRYVESVEPPVVVKADGLAAGKGVTVASDRSAALEAVDRMLKEKVFGEAGGRVLVEECLCGEEVSILALCDGEHFTLLAPSQDHKRALDGDRGANTGGMGAYSPVPMLDEAGIETVRSRIFEPVLNYMRQAGAPFQGVLYAGLMLTADGPKVLEFNVRFGDPETQAILPRLRTDLGQLILAAVEGRLNEMTVEWDPRACACVVLASQGYPGRYDMGRVITGIPEAAELENTLIFQAGTKREGGKLVTVGGRVVNVVGLGDRLEEALDAAYQAADIVRFEGKHFRRDIGRRAIRWLGRGVGVDS